MRNKNWTPEENALLIRHWPSATEQELLKLFPGCTMQQLKRQMHQLRDNGIETYRRNPGSTAKQISWTPEDNALFIKHWPSADRETILKLFPGQTMRQLSYHARNLKRQGIEVQPRKNVPHSNQIHQTWTEEDVKILIKNWATASKEELLQLLPGRTMHQLENKVSRLRTGGVDVPERRAKSDAGWSQHDIQVLIKYWAILPTNELFAKFENKNRTVSSCYAQAAGLRKAGIHIPMRSVWLDRRPHEHNVGAYYDKNSNLWRAEIRFHNVKYSLGSSKSKSDAIMLRERANKALEPIQEELHRLSGVRTDPEFQKARSEIITRGHNILHTLSTQNLADLKCQLKSKTEVAEDA